MYVYVAFASGIFLMYLYTVDWLIGRAFWPVKLRAFGRPGLT